MRRLGRELGVEAMSLYRHVEGKTALLDEVHVAILRGVDVSGLRSDPALGLRAMLGDFAKALRAALLKHPNAIPVVASRPFITDETLTAAEAADEIGLHTFGIAGRPALESLAGLVIGITLAELAPEREPNPWLDPRNEGPLERLTPFELGLDAFLEGLEAIAREDSVLDRQGRKKPARRRRRAK